MSRNMQIQFAPLTKIVKFLIIANVAIWFVGQIIISRLLRFEPISYLALTPQSVIENFQVWRLFTYMFLHTADQASSVTHILFNMLMLWFFGGRLEQMWGRTYFLFYYIATGFLAGFVYTIGIAIYSFITGEQTSLIIPVIGASGAIFGLIIAYGLSFRYEVIYFMGLFPMRALTFALLAGVIDFASLVSASVTGGGVAYLAHLGGFGSGYCLMQSRKWYRRYQERERTKKKYKNLRLVVDNEDKNSKNGPKYWN